MRCTKCDNQVGNNFKFCNKCGEPLIVNEKNEDVSEKVKEVENIDFFIVPTTRLIIFSILSFGFYSVYWFGRNFSAIKESRQARGKETRPVLWGLFSVLTADILFTELYLMHEKATGVKFKVPSGVFALLYFLGMVIGQYILLSPFVFIVTVLIFQAKLKKYQYLGLYNYEKSKFKWGEVVIVLVGVLIFFASFSNAVLEQAREKVQVEQNTAGTKLTYSVMQEVARDSNKELPKMIDSDTRLDSVIGIENGLIYKYTLVNHSKSDLSGVSLENELREGMVNSVCTSPEMEIYVKNKATLSYDYYDKNNELIEQILIDTGKDCI